MLNFNSYFIFSVVKNACVFIVENKRRELLSFTIAFAVQFCFVLFFKRVLGKKMLYS